MNVNYCSFIFLDRNGILILALFALLTFILKIPSLLSFLQFPSHGEVIGTHSVLSFDVHVNKSIKLISCPANDDYFHPDSSQWREACPWLPQAGQDTSRAATLQAGGSRTRQLAAQSEAGIHAFAQRYSADEKKCIVSFRRKWAWARK